MYPRRSARIQNKNISASQLIQVFETIEEQRTEQTYERELSPTEPIQSSLTSEPALSIKQKRHHLSNNEIKKVD